MLKVLVNQLYLVNYEDGIVYIFQIWKTFQIEYFGMSLKLYPMYVYKKYCCHGYHITKDNYMIRFCPRRT